MKGYWSEIAAPVFASGAVRDHIAILPLGACEQHGPHLPLSTDTDIGDGLMRATLERLPDDAKVLVLPTLAVTNSVEHTNRAGTVSAGRDLTFRIIMALARDVARAGLSKLVIINAHGGNVGVMVDAAHAIRAELGLLCVVTNWMRLGLPDGLIDADARARDIHGGRLETSLMLALRPELVAMKDAASFASEQDVLAQRFDLLRAYGPIGFGWMGDDLNPSGAVGDAAAARAEDGAAIVAHQADRMARLLDEVARYAPDWLA